MSTYLVQSTPPPYRGGRSYTYGQPAQYPYQGTPYSPYNPLPAMSYGPTPSAAFYVAPSVSGRSRSHSRPRHSHTHHRSHHGHHQSHRRSHSHNGHRQHRSNGHHSSYRYPNTVTSTGNTYYREAPSLGSRILSFFGLGNSNRDRYGRPYDSRGRPTYKY